MTHSTSRKQQIEDFLKETPFAGAELYPLPGDASFRRYIRVKKGKKTAMLMDAPPEKENVRPYIAVARHLYEHGYSAPKIIAADEKNGLALIEDFGDDALTSLLKKDNQPEALEQKLYEAAVDLLVRWRAPLADPKHLPLPAYDTTLLLQEVRLFADWYLPQVMGKDRAKACREEYLSLWRDILSRAPLDLHHFVHRDYHADNLMWLAKRRGVNRIGLLDFQDGVYGDAAYDLVSLLEDARRDVPEPLAMAMLERYIEAAGCDRERFLTAYAVLGAQRNSKIVGIFSRLAARDGKQAYLHFLPRVWRYLERDLSHPALRPLQQWLDEQIPAEWRGKITIRHDSNELALTA